jgi:hypothetical protein
MEQILEDVRRLIRENILPRLTEVEIQVSDLRKETWPVCQAIMENNLAEPIYDITQRKRRYLASIDDNEADYLLRRKSSIKSFISR